MGLLPADFNMGPVVKVQYGAEERHFPTYRKWLKAFPHIIFSVDAGNGRGRPRRRNL